MHCIDLALLQVLFNFTPYFATPYYQDADKSLARPGRKQDRKHVREARDFNNIETSTVIKLFFLQGKAPKEIHSILTETLACFLLGWAKDLSAPLYIIFSSWLFPVSYVQMPVSAANPETSSSRVLPLCCEINFEPVQYCSCRKAMLS